MTEPASCWLNGSMMEMDAACIDPRDRGLLLGDGVFETVAVFGGRPAHLERHMLRLACGARVLRLVNPWSDATMMGAVEAMLRLHPMAGSLRLTLTRGPAARGLLAEGGSPTLLMTAHARGTVPHSLRAIISRTTRRNEHSPLSGIKSVNYLDAILARLAARDAGAEDAVLLNTAGNIAEATAASLFILRGSALVTPPCCDGALPGIARALLIEAGASEASLAPSDVFSADAVVLVNSLGMSQIRQLDHVFYDSLPELRNRVRAVIGGESDGSKPTPPP